MKQSASSRKNLLGKFMGFNQMRNSVYWLQRYMKSHNLSDEEIRERLIEMGKRMSGTLSTVLPLKKTNPTSIIENIYSNVLCSHVSISIDDSEKVSNNTKKIIVTDPKCPLCKYQYDDITVSGCNIVIGMVEEALNNKGYGILSSSVIESKVAGNENCVHQYIVSKGMY